MKQFLTICLFSLCASPVFARTFTPTTSGELNTLMTGGALGGFALACGDTINLTAGTTYTGNYSWPLTNCVAETTLQTTPGGSLPGTGVRNDPAYSAFLATIAPSNCGSATLTLPINADAVTLRAINWGTHSALALCTRPSLQVGDYYNSGGGGQTTGAVSPGAVTIPMDQCVLFPPGGGTLWTGTVANVTSNFVVTFTGKSASSGPCNLTGIPAVGVGSIATAIGSGDYVLNTVQDSADKAPNNIVIDQMLMNVPAAAASVEKRFVELNGATVTLKNSYLYGFKLEGVEAQAIWCVNGPGPYTIDNNTLAATTQDMLCGGYGAPIIPNMVTTGFTITRNLFTKDRKRYARCVTGAESGCGGNVYIPPSSGTWVTKNLLEFKLGKDAVIEGNIFEYNWDEGQTGEALLFTAGDQGTVGNTWLTVDNMVAKNNIFRHIGSGFQLYGNASAFPSCLCEGNNVTISNNLFYDVDGDFTGAGRLAIIDTGPDNLHIEHNTFDLAGAYYQDEVGNTTPGLYWIQFGDAMPAAASSPGLVLRNNAARYATWGFRWNSGGNAALSLFSSPTTGKNALALSTSQTVGLASYVADYNTFTSMLFPTVPQFNACYANRSTGDYTVQASCTSLYQNGTDGKDVGVDMTKLVGAGTSSYVIEGAPTGLPVKIPLPVLIACATSSAPELSATVTEGARTISLCHDGKNVTAWALLDNAVRQPLTLRTDDVIDDAGLKLYSGNFQAGLGLHQIAVLPIYGPAGDGPATVPFSLTVRPKMVAPVSVRIQ